LDSNGFDHGIYYEQNISSTTTYVEDQFPDLIANDVFDAWAFYNVATSGGTDGSSCTTQVTPSSNTAPNISGSAFTVHSGDLVVVQIDDESLHISNAVSSITVPSGCYLANADDLTTGYGIAHWTEYCIATSTSFTPQFTVAQTTHDTFTIYAAAFQSGSGGSTASSGPGVLLSAQTAFGATGSSYTMNLGCPAGTTSVFLTDDAGSISSVTDSNSNTWTGISNATLGTGSTEIFYSLGLTTTGMPNTYTVTLHTANTGNVDLPTFYCTTTSHLDTGFTAASGNTQVNSSTVLNTVTEGTGSGNCEGTASSLVNCTDLPEATPEHSPDLFIAVCAVGVGPALQTSQPTGFVADDALPAAIADVVGGDSDDYGNGDASGHFYQDSTSEINFGWKVQQNASSDTCMVTATY
jgi:hypothetical protein